MKKILRLNEFISAKRLDQAKIANKPYYLIWSNGKIIFEPTQEDRMSNPGLFTAINIQIDPTKKSIRLQPMDDWSDIKIIKKVQQALGDLKKVEVIGKDWTCVIGDANNTKRSLGSTVVEDIISYNSHFTDVIPFAFHGTSSHYIDDIKKNGIQPRSKTGTDPNWKIGYTEQSPKRIYMSMDFDRAYTYADTAVEYLKSKGIKSEPVIIVVKDLPTKYITTDDDYETNMGMLRMLQVIRTGKKPSEGKHKYIEGIRNSSQFALTKPIKPVLITDVVYTERQ